MTTPDLRVTDPETLAALEATAVTVAREAAYAVVEQRPTRLTTATKSTDTDVVTEMDQLAQDILLRRLHELRPEDSVHGEERGSIEGTSELTWVVDPIDGTVNYLYGLTAYAVSVAVVVGDPSTPGAWRPVAGAVIDPSTGETYHARLGGGSHVVAPDGTSTRLGHSGATSLSQALVATGFGYAASLRSGQARALLDVLPQVRDIRRIGSCALDLSWLARGRLDAYYETGTHAWDFAAGWLIATEAGALVGGLPEPWTDLIWACAPGLACTFPDLVQTATREHVLTPAPGDPQA